MTKEEVGGVLDRDAQIGLGAFWRCKRLAWSGSDLVYVGFNERLDAGTNIDTWAVIKLTWAGSTLTMVEGPITGVWDDRATLAWN